MAISEVAELRGKLVTNAAAETTSFMHGDHLALGLSELVRDRSLGR
jgi:hypothetical protein